MRKSVIGATMVGLSAMFMMSSCNSCSRQQQAQASEEDANTIVLFDGTSLDGWRGYNRADLPAKWTIEDGSLKFNGSGTGEGQSNDGGDIIFATPFKNFELTFDWKVDKGSNSGVFFYAKEIPGSPIYISAPEYQILDNENHPDARLGVNGNRMSASLYDMLPAAPQNAKPYGEWNTGGIMVNKGTVIHYQNGAPVVEYHLWTPEWTALINNSKFADGNPHWSNSFELLTSKIGKDDEGNLVGGYIGLQDHGDDVWFRNVKVKVLD